MQLVAARAVHRVAQALRVLAVRPPAASRHEVAAVVRAQVHDRVHQIERVPVVRVGPQEVLIDLVPGMRQALGLAVAAMIAPLAGQTPKMAGLTARH